MTKKIAFVAYYQKKNIYSFNALIGAIETEETLKDISIYFIRGKEKLNNDLKIILQNHEQVILGISFFTTQIWEISQLIKILRKKYGNKLLYLAGGPHPTGDPEETLRMGFDLVVIGEGEETLIELLKNIKFEHNILDIKGIAFLTDNDKYHFTGRRPILNLDKYPPLPIKNVRFGAIEITRGCPFICYFCQTPYILGTQPRHRSIDSICDTVKFMKRYEKTDIRFITPNAFSYGSRDGKTLNISKLEELLIRIKEIISPEGRIFLGSFPSEVRPEHVNTQTLDLVLKYAANNNIVIGAQSGSQRVLDLCHRGHTIEDVYKAVELTINANLYAYVDFIFGLPDENEKDMDLTLRVMRDLTNMGGRIHTHSFIPLPQTAFANKEAKEINTKIRMFIQKLNSKGDSFGDWKKQEKVAIKITNYLKSKKFE